MSFPGISHVLNGFKERVRTRTFFRHPPVRKRTKAENPAQEKTTKKGAIGVGKQKKKCHIPMESPRNKKIWWENTGRRWKRRRVFPVLLAGKGGGSRSPSPGGSSAPGQRDAALGAAGEALRGALK